MKPGWVILTICVFGGIGALWGHSELAERRQRFISAHHCHVESFAGRDAEPIYRCDCGLFREKDMK